MSKFFDRKIKTYFKLNDVNNDGYISLKDFVEMAERQSNAAKADASQREQLKACFVKVWRLWMKSVGSDENGLLTASIMTESMKQLRNDPEFRKAYLDICRQFFVLPDINGDGLLQKDEYPRSFANIGFEDTIMVHRAFEYLERNGDGKLCLDKFSRALLEYLTSEDENSPNALLWGPLVELTIFTAIT